MKCSTQNEVIVSQAPAQPQPEVFANTANRELGPDQLQEQSSAFSKSQFCCLCSEQAEVLRAAKSTTESLQKPDFHIPQTLTRSSPQEPKVVSNAGVFL